MERQINECRTNFLCLSECVHPEDLSHTERETMTAFTHTQVHTTHMQGHIQIQTYNYTHTHTHTDIQINGYTSVLCASYCMYLKIKNMHIKSLPTHFYRHIYIGSFCRHLQKRYSLPDFCSP